MKALHTFCSLFLMTALAVGSALSQPKVSVDKSAIDLGVTYNGQVRKARILVRNSGKETLKILSVQTSCGCTAVRQPKSELKPGESDAVELEFNSTGFRGKVTKHINIQTNDPSTPNTSVALVTDVIDELTPISNSSVVWLGSLPVGKEVEHKVGLKNVSGKVISLKGYTSSSPNVTMGFEKKAVMPADTIFITIKVKSNKVDYVNEQVMLQTDSDKQTNVPVRVTFIGTKAD